jgi:hypothetical protein
LRLVDPIGPSPTTRLQYLSEFSILIASSAWERRDGESPIRGEADLPESGWRKRCADFKRVGDAIQPFVIVIGAIAGVLTYIASEADKIQDRFEERSKPYF